MSDLNPSIKSCTSHTSRHRDAHSSWQCLSHNGSFEQWIGGVHRYWCIILILAYIQVVRASTAHSFVHNQFFLWTEIVSRSARSFISFSISSMIGVRYDISYAGQCRLCHPRHPSSPALASFAPPLEAAGELAITAMVNLGSSSRRVFGKPGKLFSI